MPHYIDDDEIIKNPSILKDLRIQPEDICLKVIENDPLNLKYIKPMNQFEKLVTIALKKNGRALQYVSNKITKYCFIAVKQNGRALQFVENQTPSICRAAINEDSWALQYVIDQSNKQCLQAVKKSPNSLRFVRNQTPQICIEALKQRGCALEYVKKQTPKMCKVAVMENGYALQYVQKKTSELCFIAVRNNSYAFEHVPTELQTENLCLIAVKQDGWNLEYVNQQTDKICRAALEDDVGVLVKVKNKTYELCLFAIKNSSERFTRYIMELIPSAFHTDELCREALKKHGNCITIIDRKIKKPWMEVLALQQNGDSLRFIPIHRRTYDYCKMAVTNNGIALKYVPEKFRTEEICNIALGKNGLALKYIRNQKIDYCKLAIKQNYKASSYSKYKTKLAFFEDSNGPDDDVCLICQENEGGGNWCKLKSCSHHYHVDCISEWFNNKKTCPYCQSKTIPEVVIVQ